jgi:hypothetical protein
MKYQIVSIVIIILGGYTMSQSCPTCLTHLQTTKNQPFFIRHISAQIVTAHVVSSKEEGKKEHEPKATVTKEKKVTPDKNTRK